MIKEIEKGKKIYYTFRGPTTLYINKEQDTIKFDFTLAQQYFPTKEGVDVKERAVSAVFKLVNSR